MSNELERYYGEKLLIQWANRAHFHAACLCRNNVSPVEFVETVVNRPRNTSQDLIFGNHGGPILLLPAFSNSPFGAKYYEPIHSTCPQYSQCHTPSIFYHLLSSR